MAEPAHHDADAIMELHNVINNLGPLTYRSLHPNVVEPAHHADAVMESLYNMTNVLLNDVSTSPY